MFFKDHVGSCLENGLDKRWNQGGPPVTFARAQVRTDDDQN